MKTLDLTALILILVGALNWGIIGLFGYNAIEGVFGFMSPIARIIYILVGLSAVYRILAWNAIVKRCKKK